MTWLDCKQHGKKVVSDSPGLVDFAIGPVDSVLKLPDKQAKFLGGSQSSSSKILLGALKCLLG